MWGAVSGTLARRWVPLNHPWHRCLILYTLINALRSRQQIVKHRFRLIGPANCPARQLVRGSVIFTRLLDSSVRCTAIVPHSNGGRVSDGSRARCIDRYTPAVETIRSCQSPELCVLHVVINELQHARVQYRYRRLVSSSRRCYASIYSDGQRKHVYRVRRGIGDFVFFKFFFYK